MSTEPRELQNQAMPLLYGSAADTEDDVPLVTPSEEEMARHLAAQLAAAEAARTSTTRQVQAQRLRVGSDDPAAAVPITAERAAELAALSQPVAAAARPLTADEAALPLPAAPPTPASPPPPAARAKDAVQPEAQPVQLGRYRVHKRLGRGALGSVYLASDPQTGGDVAIKLLHASVCESESARKRFVHEARAAAALSHPHVADVLDIGLHQGRPYMVMAPEQGRSLASLVEEKGQVPLAGAVRMALQLAQALDHVHARGLVHRNIHPGNILLAADGQTLRLGDVGISAPDRPGDRTRPGNAPGMPQYLSPEQTQGEAATAASDIYAVGVVLYEMLAGMRPFHGDTPAAVAARVVNDEPAPLAQKRPDIPPALRRVVERCLAKLPAQRYASARELADALLRVLAEIEESEIARKKARQLPLPLKWAAAVACVTALVVALGAGLVAQRQQSVLMMQAAETGRTTAGLIGALHAPQVLAEEWEAVGMQLQEAVRSGKVQSLLLTDAGGTVRASGQPLQVGQVYQAQGQALPQLGGDGATVHRVGGANGGQAGELLVFDAPVLFQGKVLGRAVVGLAEARLLGEPPMSVLLLLALCTAVVLAVAAAAYGLAVHWLRPMGPVMAGMAEIARGRFDVRIATSRNDEFGQLHQSFDAMAQALQRRQPGSDALPPRKR